MIRNRLTAMEDKVLRSAIKGRSNKEIAAELMISVNTVRTHIHGILTKLNVDSRTQAVIWGIAHINSVNMPEPAPNGGEGDMWLLVIKDMEERRAFGIDKYGTPLKAFDGRRSKKDAYQEALDLCVYLRKELYEEEHAHA